MVVMEIGRHSVMETISSEKSLEGLEMETFGEDWGNHLKQQSKIVHFNKYFFPKAPNNDNQQEKRAGEK